MKKQTKVKTVKNIIGAVLLTAILAVPALVPGSSRAATVSELRAQSASLQQQINTNNQIAKDLSVQADTLHNKLAELNLQISQLQTQIELTKTKIAELQAKLDQAQKELDRQKGLLKASLQALYKKGGASTVELLVGSDSFSQFINDQTYLERLKTGIQDSTEKVIALKQQIQSQKAEQKTLLDQQQGQQTVLQSTRSEQQSLLDQTQGQEAAYQQVVTNLKQQQMAVMQRLAAQTRIYSGDGSHGGYPYDNQGYPCSGIDPWGMCYRQCVSYTAFRVHQDYLLGKNSRDMPWWGYNGNARDWVDNAIAAGIPHDKNPRVGDVAIARQGYANHAMYVESVSGRMVYVSQYNADYAGHYSEMNISADSSSLGSLDFIHFQ